MILWSCHRFAGDLCSFSDTEINDKKRRQGSMLGIATLLQPQPLSATKKLLAQHLQYYINILHNNDRHCKASAKFLTSWQDPYKCPIWNYIWYCVFDIETSTRKIEQPHPHMRRCTHSTGLIGQGQAMLTTPRKISLSHKLAWISFGNKKAYETKPYANFLKCFFYIFKRFSRLLWVRLVFHITVSSCWCNAGRRAAYVVSVYAPPVA